MRVAVITDIHSNLPALEATLAAAEEAGVEELWCLGDIVGYGAEPDACTELVAERCAVCLVGNHDLAVLGALDISSFSEAAAAAVAWTRRTVTESTLATLRALRPDDEREGIGLFHASPRDPVWEYVLSPDQADDCFAAQPQRIGMIGHSHIALYFTRSDNSATGDVRGSQARPDLELDLTAGRWLLNPGSAGQPRDGDPRAAWLELDTEAATARFRRVDYDIERAAAAIVEAGLPKRLAERLRLGT